MDTAIIFVVEEGRVTLTFGPFEILTLRLSRSSARGA